MARTNADIAFSTALKASALRANCTIMIVNSEWTRWASKAFTGAHHELTLQASESPALDAWLNELPESELPIRGHLIADIVVTTIQRAAEVATIKLEALTVEE